MCLTDASARRTSANPISMPGYMSVPPPEPMLSTRLAALRKSPTRRSGTMEDATPSNAVTEIKSRRPIVRMAAMAAALLIASFSPSIEPERSITIARAPNHAGLGSLDLEVDRHRLFERRVRPAAGAVGVGPAKHDQAAAHLARVAHQHLDLLIAERRGRVAIFGAAARNVGQDHRVVPLQLGQRVEQPIGGRSS